MKGLIQESETNIGLNMPHDSRAFPASRMKPCAVCVLSVVNEFVELFVDQEIF
jgi:hypothetical protein